MEKFDIRNMNVSLPKAMEEFIRKKVEAGDYESASEVVRDGLRLLKQRDAIWRADVRTSIHQSPDSSWQGRTMPAKPVEDNEVALKARNSCKPRLLSLDQDGFDSAEPGSRLDHSFFDESIWSSIAESLHLPERELQIVQHIFRDHKEAWIAQTLRISPHTVNTYLQRIYHKLNVFSRSQLVLRVVTEFLALEKRPNGETREPKNKLYQ